MSQISLEWKAFTVKVDKVHTYFKTNLSVNYDGLVCDEANMHVIFFDVISQADQDTVNTYWTNLTVNSFDPTTAELINTSINEARIFGNEIIVKASVENVAMGITQAGKTRAVADLFSKLQYYLTTGSLHAAVAEINDIIAAGLDPNLEPFVTETRLNNYKQQIEDYLAS